MSTGCRDEISGKRMEGGVDVLVAVLVVWSDGGVDGRSARCPAPRAGMKSLIGGSIKLLSCGLPELSTHGRSRKKCAQPALVFFLAPRGWADQASLHSFIPAKYD